MSTLGLAPAADAEINSFYAAAARSVAVEALLDNPSIPGGITLQGGGPQTDAKQSSLDKGDANASFPYFGDAVPTLPGVASGVFGFPAPAYPLTASSTFGGPGVDVSYPGVTLRAISRANSTVADAIAGSTGLGATSHSEVDESSDGAVVATASTSSPLTVLGTVVSISGFDSVARASADPTGALSRFSATSIDEISVPGLVFTIPEMTPAGIPVPIPINGVPNQAPIPAPPVPLPFGGETIVEPNIGFKDGFFTITLPFAGETQEYALPAEPVMAAFEAQGVALSYTAAKETEDGIAAGVFSVSFTLPAPPPNEYYNGPTPVTYRIGAAQASVDRTPEATEAAAPATPAGAAAAPAQPGGEALPGAAAGLPAAGAGLGAAGAPALSGPGSLTVDAPASASAGPTTLDVRADSATFVAAGLPAFLGSDFSSIYLGLLAVALAGVAAAVVLRMKGVSAWSS